jgi:hypothetical protein
MTKNDFFTHLMFLFVAIFIIALIGIALTPIGLTSDATIVTFLVGMAGALGTSFALAFSEV